MPMGRMWIHGLMPRPAPLRRIFTRNEWQDFFTVRSQRVPRGRIG